MEDAAYKRIYWHSRRGMLELDLVLMPFVENVLLTLNTDDQDRYVKLLEEEDTDLFAWFLGHKKPEDSELKQIVELILSSSKAKN